MNRFALTMSLLAASALSLGACEKENEKTSNNEVSKKNPKTTEGKPGASRPEAKPAGPVKAPLASDLAKYTEGLKGAGKLMARFNTNHGSITCELFETQAPLTVANFVGLARGLHSFKDPATGKPALRPFYDGLIFHRVIPNFMIQGGDPVGRGTGGPGYQFAQEISPDLKHDKPGVLSMANAGPNTNGSQFFITEVPRPNLDGGYNVFGQCENVDVVKKIARVPKSGSRPNEPVIMETVEIFRGE